MDLDPTPWLEVLERFLENREVVVERGIHEAHKDKIKGLREDPVVALAVLLNEGAVTWGIERLDQTEIGPDDLRFRMLSGELAGPDTRAGANVQNLPRSNNGGFVQLAPVK